MLFKDQFLPNSVMFLIKKTRLDRLQVKESFKCEETSQAKVEAIQPSRRQSNSGTRFQTQFPSDLWRSILLAPSELWDRAGAICLVWHSPTTPAGVEIHLQPMVNPPTRQRDAQRRSGFEGSPHGAGSWQDLCSCGERSPCCSTSYRTTACGKDPRWRR